MSILAIANLETGEVGEIIGKLPDDKYIIRGHKMYNIGVIGLLDVLTKDELKRLIIMFDSKVVDYHNLLMKPFLALTEDMSKSSRSRFKAKLIENNILQEYNKRLMMNPYIFMPRGDKNIKNSKWLTQQVWQWMFEDHDKFSSEVERHAVSMFGKLADCGTHLVVGNKDNSKIIPVPTNT